MFYRRAMDRERTPKHLAAHKRALSYHTAVEGGDVLISGESERPNADNRETLEALEDAAELRARVERTVADMGRTRLNDEVCNRRSEERPIANGNDAAWDDEFAAQPEAHRAEVVGDRRNELRDGD